MAASPYPSWRYYPSRDRAPDWVADLVGSFAAVQEAIDSRTHTGVSSDEVLAAVRSGIENDGYCVETGKATTKKITRPVLFGENGKAEVAYDVDGFHRITELSSRSRRDEVRRTTRTTGTSSAPP